MRINDDLFHCFYEESRRTRPCAGAAGHAQFTRGAEWGAGWAFALVGMAEAIRSTNDYRREHTCSFCGLVDHGGAGRCPSAPECPF